MWKDAMIQQALLGKFTYLRNQGKACYPSQGRQPRKEGKQGGAGEQLDAVGIFLPTLVGSPPGANVESQGGRTCKESAWLLDYVTSEAVNISLSTLL